MSAFFPGKKTDNTNVEPTQPVNVIAPTSSNINEPTSSVSTEIVPTELPAKDGVQLITINPPDGAREVDTIEQIFMTFSSPMNEGRFYFSVNPKTPTFIHTEGNKVIITPENTWKVGKNIISVFGISESNSGTRLSTPFEYSFEVVPLPTPESGIE